MSMEELFAQAVDRVEKNQPIDDILALCTEEQRVELRELLFVVEDMVDLALQPAPTPSPVRRNASRALFLQTLLEMQIAQEAQLAPVAAAAPVAVAALKPTAPARPSLLDNLRAWAQQFRGSPFGAFAFSLAPLAALLLAAYLATFWISFAAQASVPGEPGYGIKEWAREIKKDLASAEERDEILRENDKEVRREVELMAERAANLKSVAPRVSQLLQYQGRIGRMLLVGPLRVLPNYQPDLQAPEMAPVTIVGDLRPGTPVRLEYQVLPGNPNLVQGVSIIALGAPEPTPELVAVPESVLPTPEEENCNVLLIPGWEPLAVFPGDKVTDVANRSGMSLDDIMRINCLKGQVFTTRRTILVPESYYIKVTPVTMPIEPAPVYRQPVQPVQPAAPTPTPTRRPTRTPEPTPTAIDEATPTATATGEESDEADTSAPLAPAGAATATPDIGATATAVPTGESTAAPTQDATPTDIPTEALPTTPTTVPAGEPTAAPTQDATPTDIPTEAPTTNAPTTAPTDAAPTDAATAEPTNAAESAPTATDAPEKAPTAEPQPTATSAPAVATDVPEKAPTAEPQTTATSVPAVA
ncbi:MAG: hypothetical protein KAX65_10825, partial [Caldilineaceae bacterium]|nr:hypothetical protein [Caldilineaceae bacterium]